MRPSAIRLVNSHLQNIPRDKMNSTVGFVRCFILRVSLACLGSMAKASRAGTMLDRNNVGCEN